jgi:hypothetical protein
MNTKATKAMTQRREERKVLVAKKPLRPSRLCVNASVFKQD